MGACLQDAADQTAELAGGTDFDKSPGTGIIHGQNLFTEAHRPGQLSGKEVAHIPGGFRIQLRCAVGTDRNGPLPEAESLQIFTKLWYHSGHGRAVEGGTDIEGNGPDAGLLQSVHGLLYR